MSGGTTYEIVEGVRRAKAFELAGRTTIRAVIQHDEGTCDPEIEVDIDVLLSPHKTTIDMSTNAQADRFWKIWRGVQAGMEDKIPPIIIAEGSKGIAVKDIGWSY